ncbi:hypothetical protein MFIFM68171_09601 [Madurella fahalii]|uniref:Uncharacterized protein n=1 Tax=Madurella fahalii TaxID=1157608 RepID=A0ABQ0GNT0_9PEZI
MVRALVSFESTLVHRKARNCVFERPHDGMESQFRRGLDFDANSGFWAQLIRLEVEKFVFYHLEVPEYFVYHFTRRLGCPVPNCSRPSAGIEVDNPARMFDRGSRPRIGAARTLETGLSTHSHGARQERPRHIFDLPFEIRQQIYDEACRDWIYKEKWPIYPKTFNSGIGLMHTCKQIAAEARPSLYREIDLYSAGALDALKTLGDDIALVRKINIHFSCFCPSQQGARGSIYETTLNPHYPRPEIEDEWTANWAEIMDIIQGNPGIQELYIRFDTCCRYALEQLNIVQQRSYTLPAATLGLIRQRCINLESHFVNLLERCRHVEVIGLGGDVPPNLPFCLMRPKPESLGLSLVFMSTLMSEFIYHREAYKLYSDGAGCCDETDLPLGYPQTTLLNRSLRFKLRKQDTRRAQKEKHMGGDVSNLCQNSIPFFLPDLMTERDWRAIQKSMDYDNLLRI